MTYTGPISENFEWEEFERSETADRLGIDNSIPNEAAASQIRALVTTLLQPLRTAYGNPLQISSGYRCKALNDAIGGARNSQHIKGQAADIATENPRELAALVIERQLPFDQMILHGNFIHLSHKSPRPQRGMTLYSKTYKDIKL